MTDTSTEAVEILSMIDKLKELSKAATQGEVSVHTLSGGKIYVGIEKPALSSLETVIFGVEAGPDHSDIYNIRAKADADLFAALVNAYRSGKIVPAEEAPRRVKAMVGVIGQLEWVEDEDGKYIRAYDAELRLGYEIQRRKDGTLYARGPQNDWMPAETNDVGTLKEFMQADYEARIRSAFFTPPQDAIAKTVDVETERDAARYRWLRHRDVNTINDGGVFAGVTPDNYVLNGEDLDRHIDAAIRSQGEG